MLINEHGEIDYSGQAPYLDVPTLDWPTPVKKLHERYETEWQAWADAETALIEAIAAIQTAPAEDQRLLEEAVRDGKGDPGTPTADSAARRVIFERERTRQAAATANTTAEQIREAARKHLPDLYRQAFTIERERIETLITARAAAQAAWIKAEDDARAIGTTLRWITYELDQDNARHQIEFTPSTIQWLAPYEANEPGIIARLHALEASALPHNTGHVPGTRENTFSNDHGTILNT